MRNWDEITVGNAHPTLPIFSKFNLGRSEVINEWMEILNPLQVAREDIHLKTVSLFESLKSNDTRIIQLLLQGAIQTQVNQVRLKKFLKNFKGTPDPSYFISKV